MLPKYNGTNWKNGDFKMNQIKTRSKQSKKYLFNSRPIIQGNLWTIVKSTSLEQAALLLFWLHLTQPFSWTGAAHFKWLFSTEILCTCHLQISGSAL